MAIRAAVTQGERRRSKGGDDGHNRPERRERVGEWYECEWCGEDVRGAYKGVKVRFCPPPSTCVHKAYAKARWEEKRKRGGARGEKVKLNGVGVALTDRQRDAIWARWAERVKRCL